MVDSQGDTKISIEANFDALEQARRDSVMHYDHQKHLYEEWLGAPAGDVDPTAAADMAAYLESRPDAGLILSETRSEGFTDGEKYFDQKREKHYEDTLKEQAEEREWAYSGMGMTELAKAVAQAKREGDRTKAIDIKAILREKIANFADKQGDDPKLFDREVRERLLNEMVEAYGERKPQPAAPTQEQVVVDTVGMADQAVNDAYHDLVKLQAEHQNGEKFDLGDLHDVVNRLWKAFGRYVHVADLSEEQTAALRASLSNNIRHYSQLILGGNAAEARTEPISAASKRVEVAEPERKTLFWDSDSDEVAPEADVEHDQKSLKDAIINAYAEFKKTPARVKAWGARMKKWNDARNASRDARAEEDEWRYRTGDYSGVWDDSRVLEWARNARKALGKKANQAYIGAQNFFSHEVDDERKPDVRRLGIAATVLGVLVGGLTAYIVTKGGEAPINKEDIVEGLTPKGAGKTSEAEQIIEGLTPKQG